MKCFDALEKQKLQSHTFLSIDVNNCLLTNHQKLSFLKE